MFHSSSERHLEKTEGQFFQIPEAGNLVLDAYPFDGGSYRLSSADPTSGLSILQCCLRALSSLIHIPISKCKPVMKKTTHPTQVPHLTAYLSTVLPLFFDFAPF